MSRLTVDAALLYRARVVGALDRAGVRHLGEAVRAADGVAEQHVLLRLFRFDVISATCVACIMRP